MNDKILFYSNPMSRARTIHWMLEEVGAPYETVLIDFKKKEHKQPKYLAINPMGKLPSIVHRGVVVTESAAICAYLADAFPSKKLAPPLDDPSRGTYLRWFFFAAACGEPAVTDHMHSRPPCDKPWSIGYGTYEDTMATLEKALQPGPFLLGEKFSAADVYLASLLGWGLMTKAIEPNPTFQSYHARCGDRPAVKRAMEKTKELEMKLK